jgi:hypothetical protein
VSLSGTFETLLRLFRDTVSTSTSREGTEVATQEDAEGETERRQSALDIGEDGYVSYLSLSPFQILVFRLPIVGSLATHPRRHSRSSASAFSWR